jgi:hypothetical protein
VGAPSGETGEESAHGSAANPIVDAFKPSVAGAGFVYVLEFSPKDGKQDGTYHALRVNVDQEGLKLQARRGYVAAKPGKKK